jgi:molybdenum cofactor cytidylyltransferase
MIAAIILAAGASTRLGEPKQLVEIAGETLLERAVRTARDAGCSPLIVVLGSGYVEILGNTRLGDAVPVINAEWPEGMASSIRLGVRTLAFIAKATPGVVLMTCDQPAVTASHLRALIATGLVTASSYAERRGVPAYFPNRSFAALMQLRGDLGARDLLRDSPVIDLPGGELDIDTAPDLDTAKQLFGKHS